jgi:hypothetical protein
MPEGSSDNVVTVRWVNCYDRRLNKANTMSRRADSNRLPDLIMSLNQLGPIRTSVSGQQVVLRTFSIISDAALSSGYRPVPVGLQ